MRFDILATELSGNKDLEEVEKKIGHARERLPGLATTVRTATEGSPERLDAEKDKLEAEDALALMQMLKQFLTWCQKEKVDISKFSEAEQFYQPLFNWFSSSDCQIENKMILQTLTFKKCLDIALKHQKT